MDKFEFSYKIPGEIKLSTKDFIQEAEGGEAEHNSDKDIQECTSAIPERTVQIAGIPGRWKLPRDEFSDFVYGCFSERRPVISRASWR